MVIVKCNFQWNWTNVKDQMAPPQLYTVAEQTAFERSCTFSSAVSECLSVFTVCSPQHHSLTNSGHDSCPDWCKEPCYCYMRFAKCNGRSSERWNTEQILFAVRKQDWKNSAVKTSMTKHETATAANEACLVNSTVSSVKLREMLALAAH